MLTDYLDDWFGARWRATHAAPDFAALNHMILGHIRRRLGAIPRFRP